MFCWPREVKEVGREGGREIGIMEKPPAHLRNTISYSDELIALRTDFFEARNPD